MKSNLPKAITLGLLTGIVGLIVSLLPFGPSVEEDVGLDWLFKLRGARQPPPDVIVVAIDKVSADALDVPNKPWKWPRSLHASLTKKLGEAGARVIAFDMFFEEPRLPLDDKAFANAIKEAGNVVLFKKLEKEDKGKLVIERLIPPIDILAESALALAPFPLPKIPAKVKQAWLFKAGDVPTLPAVAFQIFALQAYDDFIALLEETSAGHVAKLPPNGRELSRAKGVEELLQTLRAIFQSDPSIADRMLQALENHSRTDLDKRKKRILMSLISLYQGKHSRYLNYYGPPRSITTVPYHEVIQDPQAKAAPLNFDGKAVFVGASELSPEQQDRFYTPFTSRKTGFDVSGVEIAATAFANLFETTYVRPLNPVGITLVWGFLVSIICRLLPTVVAITSSLLLSACYFTISYHLFKSSGIWCPIVVPLLIQSPVALFGAVLWRYVDTNRERQNIRKAFGYYLPSQVVDQLARSVSDLRARSQLAYGTCLSTDAEQYTSLSERMEPKELEVLMNNYYEAIFQPVRGHGGIVSDVVGDSMLAIWATSQPDAELRTQACLASLDIAGAVESFSESSGSPKLPTRMGLHSGQMLLGSIGAVDHYEYRAVGDIVNTSTRIQGLNKQLGTRILVSEEVLEGLQGFLSREIGKFLLVGKSKPVVLHELMCCIEDCDESQRRLCTAFAYALTPFRVQRWQEASSRFSRLLQEHGPDGPSRLYLKLCDEYRHNPPVASWDGVISVDTK